MVDGAADAGAAHAGITYHPQPDILSRVCKWIHPFRGMNKRGKPSAA